jgi:hypothetical protein
MLRKEDVLGALQLLAAMYPLEGELELSEPASAALAAAESSEVYEAGGTTALDVVVRVTIEDESERALQVSITLPFDAPTSVAVRQPSWLPRAEFSALEDGLPRIDADEPASDAIMAAIEYVRSSGTLAAQAEDDKAEAAKAEGVLKAKEGSADTDPGSLCRVWLWLPGLETREKRRDLVVYAPTYALTGFVLAGKPGLICLEGGGKAVDRYMAVIKSESWGDVPSFQKKVSYGSSLGECGSRGTSLCAGRLAMAES